MIIDKNQNFWQVNPGFEVSEFFFKFKKKKQSSEIMWALTYCLNPDSPIFASSNKWEDVKKTILKDDKFNWESKENLELAYNYKELILSTEEKSYLYWCEHMKKRQDFCATIDYSSHLTSVKQIELAEDMMSKNVKLFEDLKRIKIILENKRDSVKKERPKSLSDSGLI